MDRKRWARLKNTGGFKRKVKKNYTALLAPDCIRLSNSPRQVNLKKTGVGSVQNLI